MTAIAYKAGIVAADRKVTFGNVHCEYKKISVVDIPEIGPCVIALAGKVRAVEDIKKYLSESKDGRGTPFADCSLESRYGIAVTRGLVVYPIFGDGKLGEPDLSPIIAEGNGFEFLMGAMAAGADAPDAVSLACQHCDAVGRGVDVVNVVDVIDEFIQNRIKAPF